MRFTQCPYCGELFSKSTWRKTQQGEYECFRCGNCFDVDAIENEGNAKHQETEELAKIPNLLNNLEFREAENRLFAYPFIISDGKGFGKSFFIFFTKRAKK